MSEGKKGEGALRLDHIGVAVDDLEGARRRYAAILGLEPSPIEEVPSEGVRVCFFDLDGCRLELLEPTAADSPVRRFLDSGRKGVHHLSLALEAGDLRARLEEWTAGGVAVVPDAAGEAIRRGSGETEVLFLHPREAEGVLLEFSQESEPPAGRHNVEEPDPS